MPVLPERPGMPLNRMPQKTPKTTSGAIHQSISIPAP
jgi:hypothetical protein